MQNIIGLGSTPQDKWSMYGQWNSYMYEGMDSDEYLEFKRAENKIKNIEQSDTEIRNEFWAKRDEAVQNTASTIHALAEGKDNSLRHLAGEELGSLLVNTDVANADAIIQVQGANKQWKKLDRILSGKGGTVLGYDIETFGDTTGRNGLFGITEIGIGKTVIGDNGSIKQKGHGLVIGLDETEVQYVTDILNKIKSTGWGSLEEYEAVAMKRMSMYGGDSMSKNFKSVFSKESITELGGEFYTVKKLANESMNLEQIERGIKFLSDVYQDGATRDAVLRPALDYLWSMHEPNTAAEGAIITGANTRFDTGTIQRYSDMYGIDTTVTGKKGSVNIVDMLKKDTVDLVYGTRTAAAIRTISVSELQRQAHGKPGGGASVQSLLYSSGLNEVETHLSISDINQTIKLLAAEKFIGTDLKKGEGHSLPHDITRHFKGKIITKHNSADPVLKNYDAKNSVFLLNRGWLNKNEGKDIALIPIADKDGNITYEATQNYTMTGEYWELDTDHSGYADGQYVLSLKSTADGTIVSKQFDTVEDMGTFLRSNADWFEKNQIINPRGKNQDKHTKEQALVKYRDRGRREFERAIDPSSVAVENGKATGGFASMEEYLAWHDKYGGKYDATPEGFQKYVQDLRATKEGFDIKNANSAQAALGMQEKISQESALLKSIVQKINAAMPDADNMTKTIALRKAYTSAIEEMKKGRRVKSTRSKSNRVAKDIFGVDVDYSVLKDKIDARRNPYVNYDSVNRINTYSVDSAARDINRIFGKLTKNQAIDILGDFQERGILSESQVANFSEMIRETGVDAGGDIKKAKNIDKILHNDSSYQLYTDIAYALHEATKVETQNNVIVQGRKERGRKAPQFTIESYSENLYANSNLIFRQNKQDYNVNGLYGISEVQKAVDSTVAQSIAVTPRVTYYDKTKDKLREELKLLTERLNYGSDITKTWTDKSGIEHSESFLETMFFASDKLGDGSYIPKGYNISQHKDIHTIIVQPGPEQSAYMLMTNDKNYGKMMDVLSRTTQEDLSSFSKLRNSEISKYAGIYELPYIQRYTIEDKVSDAMKKLIGRDTIDLTVFKQSENSEKFLINVLNTYESGGKLNAHMNNGVYDLLTAWRMGGEKGLEQIKEGEFEKFTSGMRRQQNQKISELSGSSSYRGYITESGKVVRMTNYGPGDYLYAYQARMSHGLHDIFSHALSGEEGSNANALDKLVDAFAEEFGEYHNQKREGLKQFRQRIAKQSYFEEFFNKNLFLGEVNDDFVIQGKYGDEFKGRTVFGLLLDTVQKDTAGLFNDNVREVLKNIADVYKEDGINQVNSVTAMEKGVMSLGIKPGEYDVNAFLYSTLRPTYLQQNLGRSFNPDEEWNVNLEGNVLAVNEMGKVEVKNGSQTSQIRILKTIAGSPEITAQEYLGKKALANYQPGHGNKVRHIMTAFKQMNDYDLQMKYRYMYENATTIANKVGMSVEQYRQYLDYMREDMLSVNEGKWFMDPLLGEQRLIRTNDAKKVFGFHIDDIDKNETEAILNKLSGKEIEQNTIIARTHKGKAIYYQGPRGVLTDANVQDLLETGETRIIPKMADIIDAKVMFNGSEKATAHAISVGRFMEYADAHGIAHGTREETTYALSRIFNILSDEAGFIGTQELEKHSNLSALDSLWRTITTYYVHEGKGQSLVNYLNANLHTDVNGKTLDPFFFENGTIISNSSSVKNPTQYITDLWNAVQDNKFGDSELNKKIVDMVNWMQENNIIYGSMQFQNQNEHVSKGISVDKRMEQAIRERILSIKDGGERWDLEWADELNKYAETYNGKSYYGNKQQGYHNTQKVFDYFNQNMNVGKTANIQKRRDMERGLHGIIESLIYYDAPGKVDVANKNIVSLDLQKLMSGGIVPKNGVSVASLHSSLFFEDGNPSEMLRKIAKEQGKHFGTKVAPASYSMYIDLGDFKFRLADGKTTANGFLIPIQTVITGADNTMFQNQQSVIASALSKIENLISNPGTKNSDEITTKLSGIVADMYKRLFSQLAVQNKDSDLYKTLQRHFMPNSGGLLAEQEVGPLLTQMTDDADFVKAVDRRNELEAMIANRKYDEVIDDAVIKELNEQYTIINDKLTGLAKSIRENGEIMNFTALKGTRLEGLEKQILRDGTSRYSFVAATSKAAFEAQGLNFGKFGLDILQDYEFNNGKYIPKIILGPDSERDLFSEIELTKVRKDIMNRINSDNSLGINITSEKTMVSEINTWLTDNYFKSIKKGKKNELIIDTETLNKDIAANGPISRLFKHFESVGEHYMREIGMVGELTRYPNFRSQLAAKWILNDHVESKQVIMFNPITSSLTNVDFDGDLMYSIFRLDGAAPFLLSKEDIEKRGDAKTVYNKAMRAYEEGLKHIPDLLADLVEDGEAVKSNRINNTIGQMAAILEKFNPEAYNEAIRKYEEDYAQKHGLSEFKIEKNTAEEYVARTSSFVQNAFSKMQMNMLYDTGIQKASIAPVLRKANIGRISTPNFTVRNVIIGMQSHYRSIGDKETENTITDILNAVSNMRTKKGGLFDHAEQAGIDTKHVWDAMTTSQVARYSTGINLLFGRFAKATSDKQEIALTHIVSGLYNNVFVKTQEVYDNRSEGIKAIVDEVMAHKGDMKYFVENKTPDGHLKHGLVALMKLQEIDEPYGLANVKRMFTNALNQGRTFSSNGVYMDKLIFESIEDMMTGKYKSFDDNTFLHGLGDQFAKSVSQHSLQISPDYGYVELGSLKGNYNDYVYTLVDSGFDKEGAYAKFDVLKYDRKLGTFVPYHDKNIPKGSNSKKISRTIIRARDNYALNKEFHERVHGQLQGLNSDETGGITTFRIKNFKQDAHKAIVDINTEKQSRLLSDITLLPKKDSFAKSIALMDNINAMDNMGDWAVDIFGRKQFETIRGLFGSGPDTARIAKRASELGQVFEYAQSKGLTGTRQIQPNELISQINRDIASNPDKYRTKNDDDTYTFTKMFDKILEEKFISDGIFDSVDRIESIRKEMIALSSFDSDAYKEARDKMRSNLYNVETEASVLEKQYEDLAKNYRQSDAANLALEGKDVAIQNFRKAITEQNMEHVHKAEDKIYSLFKNRDQLDIFFGTNTTIASGETMVSFGEYIGYRYDELSIGDIGRILSSVSEYTKNGSTEAKYAAEKTSALLGQWSATIGVPAKTSALSRQQVNSDLLNEALKEVDKIKLSAKIELDAKAAEELAQESVEQSVSNGGDEVAKEAAKSTSEKMKKRTLTDELLGKAKQFFADTGIKGKHIGFVAAGMAALGIANNLLHGQENDSPLTPAKKHGRKDAPAIAGNRPEHSSPSGFSDAPRSVGNKVVYHDRQSGFNFKVSAKTAQNLDPRQQGINIGTMTGGQANVNVYQDNSGVTDNWLANKFAELS